MIEVIPAIDLIGGQCVRLTQGDYDRKTTYYKDPLDAALRYEECGAGRLHLVDLDGAKASRPANLGVLERIAARTSLEVQYGGGIKSTEALRDVFGSGASRAICGSIAVARPDLLRQWLTEFGPERIVLGADTRDGRVAVNGWQEASAIGVEELIGRFADSGLRQVICTDIAKDGMLSGPVGRPVPETARTFSPDRTDRQRRHRFVGRHRRARPSGRAVRRRRQGDLRGPDRLRPAGNALRRGRAVKQGAQYPNSAVGHPTESVTAGGRARNETLRYRKIRSGTR